ncbi:unnamed protein product [Polarella glacialis]|uniref:Uncharacterized protein n=1 Tax=Polarella glacialis TaxID=89957 RepID=A0A813G911_POLGL|nr:unnamed protein product [Polarella glacialis]
MITASCATRQRCRNTAMPTRTVSRRRSLVPTLFGCAWIVVSSKWMWRQVGLNRN